MTSNSQHYVRYDDPTVSPSIENEEGLVSEIISLINRVQQHNFSLHRHWFRGTHVKTQAVVIGALNVQPDLPPHLAVGICSPENAKKPHSVALRFANEPSFMTPDTAPGPRGCGMKIFNVDGNFMDPVGERTRTQDMTFNNAPILELKDLPTTVEVFRIRENNFFNPDKINDEIKKRDDKDVQLAPAQLPNQNFVSYVMYSQSAYRWGDYVAKYALFPTSKIQQELESQKIDENSDPDQHTLWLQRYFEDHDAEYDLRVQLCCDLDEQSVENTQMQWDEEKYPFGTVAKVVFPKQQGMMDGKRRTFWEEQMKLNVWYGLKEHEPLGSVNRLRKELYKASAKKREEGNAGRIKEVKSVDEIP